MNTKRNLIFLSLFVFSTTFAGDKTDKTFFMPRSVNSNLALQMCNWHSYIYKKQDDYFGSNFQMSLFFQQSNNGKDLSKYFMFDGKNSLKVATPAVDANADINPYNFNLRSSYSGTFSFKPEQQVWGSRFDFYQDLYRLVKGLYISFAAPVVNVENDPGLTENVITEADLPYFGPKTITEAFAGDPLTSDWSERWQYGKIEGKKHECGLADVDVKLGYKIFEKKSFKLGVNLGLTVPMGNKAQGVYFFEPIVGNGRHWAFGGGLDTTIRLWKNDEATKKLSLFVAADYRYLFENNQVRTLELKDKHWGRYIRMRQQDPEDATRVLANSVPGINVMTRNVKVTPGSQVDAVASLNLKCNKWNFELGYNFWFRDSEDVKLKNAWDAPGKFGLIADTTAYQAKSVAPNANQLSWTNQGALVGVITNNVIQTQVLPQLIRGETALAGISPDTTISTNADTNINTRDSRFIEESDVDTNGNPTAISHKIYGGLTYGFDFKDQPMFVGLGGSYEFPQNNAALEQWAVWFKLGVVL